MGFLENRRKKARRTSVIKFAAASGLHPHPEGPGSEADLNAYRKIATVSNPDVPIPDTPLGPLPGSVFHVNVLYGQWQGLPVTEADCSIYTTGSHDYYPVYGPSMKMIDFQERRFSALVADLPAALPDLMIRRKMPGFGGRPTLPYHVEAGPPEFNRKFQVTTANTAFAGKLLDASMITWLMSADLVSAFMFKLYGRNLLLVWTDLLPESRLGAIFDTAKSFTGHISRQIWTEYGTS